MKVRHHSGLPAVPNEYLYLRTKRDIPRSTKGDTVSVSKMIDSDVDKADQEKGPHSSFSVRQPRVPRP